MAKFNEKISTILNSQLPEFVVADHPKFAEFLKVYYQLLESAELEVTSVLSTTGILLQSETGQENNLVLNSSRIDTARTSLDAGDKILLEESDYGKFTRGETIVGQTTGATAVVLVEDLDNNRLIISAQDKFGLTEDVVGQSSNARATINNYKPNPVNNIVDLINFRDPDKVINHFLFNFRDEFLATLPENLSIGVDKRKLIKNVKSLYRAKGSVRGHEMFFRILFGETSETLYPRENLLKASDGQFDSLKVLRVIASVGDPTLLIGRQITGQSSGCVAIVENTSTFQIGSDTVTQLILNADSIVGNFTIGEVIQGTSSDGDDYFIKANVTGIPGTKSITNDGSLNTITDTITVTAGGQGALFQVEEIGPGSITNIIIDNGGTGYEVGDALTFNNSGTNGNNAAGFVKIVNGGFEGEDGTSDMSTGDRIVLEDATQSGDRYAGDVIVQEKFTDLQPITDIFLTNAGSQYTVTPTVSVTSSTGTSATIRAYGDDIGRIVKLKTVELGKGYETAPTPPVLGFFNNMIVTSVSGTFLTNGTVTGGTSGATGTIVSLDTDRGLLRIKAVSGTFTIDETITSNTSGTCTLKKLDVSTATVNVVSVADTDGAFISERGKVSETTMRIQDSLYYQDFSYVLKVGRSINEWRDAFKKTMHTAGFYFTGQVNIQNRLNVRAIGPVIGSVSNVTDEPLFAIVNTLFSTIFGRRLGTVDDGTSLRANPQSEGAIDSNALTKDHFTSNTRDLTLTREAIEFDIQSRMKRTITDENGNPILIKRGFAYAGPRWSSINRFGNTVYGTSNAGSNANSFENLENVKIMGTDTSFDGRNGIFIFSSNENGRLLKTNYAFPSSLSFNAESFDNTLTRFDFDTITFDDTTP